MTVKEIEQFIVIGSKYRILSKGGDDKPLISTGEFRGYAAFANETALCLKLDPSDGKEGRMRFIPYHAILAIDVVTMATPEAKRESEEARVYYR